MEINQKASNVPDLSKREVFQQLNMFFPRSISHDRLDNIYSASQMICYIKNKELDKLFEKQPVLKHMQYFKQNPYKIPATSRFKPKYNNIHVNTAYFIHEKKNQSLNESFQNKLEDDKRFNSFKQNRVEGT